MSDEAYRPAVLDDLATVNGLIHAAVEHLFSQGIDQWDEYYPTLSDLKEDIHSGCMHLLERDGRVLAMGVINCVEEPEWAEAADWLYRPARVCALHRLCVHPLHQSQGDGQRMLRHLESLAKAQGYAAIRLDAFLQNPHALRFYERMGYRYAGQVRFRKGLFGCYEKAL